MTPRRNRLKAVLVKRFLSPEEAAKLHEIEVDKLLEVAYLIGAVYEIKTTILINESLILDFLKKGKGFEIVTSTEYMPYQDAVKMMGFLPREFEVLAYRAKAVYRIGTRLYVNVEEFKAYMKKFQTDFSYKY